MSTNNVTLSDTADDRLSPTIRARMDRVPLLTAAQEAALFREVRAAHAAAWDAVLREGAMVDGREGDGEWMCLRAAQGAALAVAKRMINLRGSHHATRRAAGRTWWLAVARTRDTLEAITEMTVEHNLRMCVHEARRFCRSRLSFNDRVQAAAMGCLHAVKAFDPARGYRFSTFATHWIRHEVQRAEQNTADTIRVPVHMHETRRVVARAYARLSAAASGATPTPAEVAAAAGRDVAQIRKVARMPRVVSADAPVGTGTKAGDSPVERTVLDTIADAAPDADDALHDARAHAALAEALRRLPAALQDILRSRFGVTEDGAGTEPQTLKDIGERYDLSRERIRQLEVQGVKHLRVLVPAILARPEHRNYRQQRVLEHFVEAGAVT